MSKSVIYTFDASELDKSLPAHCLYSCGNTLQSLLKDQGVKGNQMISVLKGGEKPHTALADRKALRVFVYQEELRDDFSTLRKEMLS